MDRGKWYRNNFQKAINKQKCSISPEYKKNIYI